MPAPPACPVCGDAAVIEFDSAAGNAVCTTCGYVVDENAIVSEITFGESASGAAVLQGSQVGHNQLAARTTGPRGRPQQSLESRTQTLENGLRKLMSLAQALKLPDSIAESAHRFFTLAVSNGFVMGRRAPYVLASCIYVACRMAKLPTMLIDISDLLQVNVFIVGATYLRLVQGLCLQNLPLIDPSIYISRFAGLLEFGPDTQKVAYDATRLIKRFDQDWMNSGRRPAGLVGASLLISARMNGFRRSILEIVQVVKMADVTIKKRLDEFKSTPSGQLTVDEFRNQWLEVSEDPPAFKRSLEKRRRSPQTQSPEPGSGLGSDHDQQSSSRLHSNPTARAKQKLKADSSSKLKRKTVADGSDDESEGRWGADRSDSESVIEESFQESHDPAEYEKEIERVIAREVETHLSSSTGSVLQNELDEKERKAKENARKLDDTRLDDLDEAELDRFILNDAEVEIKTRVWMELNREYLEKLADKKEREAAGELRPVKKYPARAKMKPRDSENPGGATVEESVKNMITSKKKFSSKINYEIANSLFGSKGNKDTDKESRATRKKRRVEEKHVKEVERGGIDDGHVSLLSNQKSRQTQVDEEDDDDEEDDELEEEEIVDDAEFAILKRDNIREEEDLGWEAEEA